MNIALDNILQAVCSVCEVSIEDVRSSSGRHHLVEARAIFSIKSNASGFKAPEIAAAINRNRTSVLYYLRVYPFFLQHDENLKRKFFEVFKILINNHNHGLQS